MDLSFYICEVAKASIKCKAKKIDIIIDENIAENYISIKIADNGKAIGHDELENIRNPFKKDEISLSIPMLEQICKLCNGELSINSENGIGTVVTAVLEYNNIDRPPLGEMSLGFSELVTSNPEINFKYIHIYNGKQFIFDAEKIKGIMNDDQIIEPAMKMWIKDSIDTGIEGIK